MKCSYCTLSAETKCACSRPFMCQTHLGPHITALKNHSFEPIDIDLENGRLNSLRSMILKEVQKVDLLKVDVSVKTRTLIKSIKKLFKLTLEKIDALTNSYLCILQQSKFTKSDLETIQKIEKMDLKIKIIDIENIKKQVDYDYLKEFFEYEIKDSEKNRIENERKIKEGEEYTQHPERSNSYIEMNLEQKIQYFCNLIPGKDLNWWQQVGKEILVTNDGEFVFACSIYSGI